MDNKDSTTIYWYRNCKNKHFHSKKLHQTPPIYKEKSFLVEFLSAAKFSTCFCASRIFSSVSRVLLPRYSALVFCHPDRSEGSLVHSGSLS